MDDDDEDDEDFYSGGDDSPYGSEDEEEDGGRKGKGKGKGKGKAAAAAKGKRKGKGGKGRASRDGGGGGGGTPSGKVDKVLEEVRQLMLRSRKEDAPVPTLAELGITTVREVGLGWVVSGCKIVSGIVTPAETDDASFPFFHRAGVGHGAGQRAVRDREAHPPSRAVHRQGALCVRPERAHVCRF